MRATILLLAIPLSASCDSSLPDLPPPRDQAEPAPPPLPGSDDFANQSFPSSLTVLQAKEILARTNTFAVSFDAYYVFPRQLQAFNVLLDQSDAVDHFAYLAQHAGPAGRLYALAAFAMIDEARARELAHLLDLSPDTVRTISGHVYHTVSVRELATEVRDQRLGNRMRDLRDRVYASFARAPGSM